ncbi:TonB-dependent receptor plug domain-containing protein [Luteibacter jiangsuensis]
MLNTPKNFRRSILGIAIASSLMSFSAFSQDATSTDTSTDGKSAQKLDAVTVTGSLIPISQIETATPTITVTAEQIKAKGFSTIAEVLQSSSFATGSVQGAQFTQGFTPGAQSLSMFGLPVGFTKYLIDGRPMGNFPALYNGSDSFNSISGIPADLVDHIDILPGGQSSLYGSDAIAGVINIVLKKKVDRPTIDYRYGWTSEGGGQSHRLSFADSFQWDKLNVLVGAQLEKVDPIWASQRNLSKQYFTGNPNSPAAASRDFLVNSLTTSKNSYIFADPNDCANTVGLNHGGEGKQYRSNQINPYCGSYNSPGFRTMQNESKNADFYTHATFDITPDTQLYGDFLYHHGEQKWTSGPGYMWWGSQTDFGPIYDPNLDDYVALQRGFTDEEVGGYKNIMNKQTENSLMTTLGANGVWDQKWNWDLGFTHSEDHLNTSTVDRLAEPMDDFFVNKFMGPDLGPDPYGGGYSSYAVNYDQFYRPITPAEFASFTTRDHTKAKTWDNMLRFQVTNGDLFSLPGGDAGIAMVAEGGNQGWEYTPSYNMLNDNVWGASDVQGAGHRSRYALTSEFRAPILSWLTLDVSGRYDGYHVADQTIDHGTYNFGIEVRPFDTLLLRGKYGTAFKAPNLSDQFMGESGYYSTVTDYSNCARLGFDPNQSDKCDPNYSNAQFAGKQSGNTALQPITAKVWSYGFVWSPVARMKLSVDYLHWDISNEVAQESADKLVLDEYHCNNGDYDPTSPTCVNAYSKIVRNPATIDGLLGTIASISTPKVNVSNEKVNALNAEFSYMLPTAHFGSFMFDTSYSDLLKHTYQPLPGDDYIDLLRRPDWSTDFKSKVNGSITWISPGEQWSTTAYFNRYGSTPNYAATQSGDYVSEGAGKLKPWITYNASVSYRGFKDLELSFLMNNVFNKMPPKDHSYLGTEASPWNELNYNIYGRTMYVEANYKF